MLGITVAIVGTLIICIAVFEVVLTKRDNIIGDLRSRLLTQQVDWDLHCAQAEKVANTTATARAFKKQRRW